MKKVNKITEKLTREILEFLYNDELINVLTIHYFENNIKNLGELYVSYKDDILNAILHTKDDGNSHFTTFYADDTNGMNRIANLLSMITYKDLLLAGKDTDVQYLMDSLNRKGELYLNTYYKYNNQPFLENKDSKVSIRKAHKDDFNIVRDYMIKFFEAESEEAKDKISNNIDLNKIRILEKDKLPLGLGSFFGCSKNYIDISSVYIDKQFRGKGYGKILMQLMIDEASRSNKIAVLQASVENDVANNTYTSVGFEKVSGYAFQFINENI